MMQMLPGDSTVARWALVRGGLNRGWTRILGAPRNALIIETLRDLTESGVHVEYLRGAMVIKGIGFNKTLWRRTGGNVQGGVDRTDEWSKFIEVPGDARLAGAWIVAALATGRELTLERVFVDPPLEHLIGQLAFAGATIERRIVGDRVSTLRVRRSKLRAFSVDALVSDRTIPLLAIAATSARGVSSFPAHTQRARQTIELLTALGMVVHEHDGRFTVDGPQEMTGGTVRCDGDVEVGLAACVASIRASGVVHLDDPEAIVLNYPQLLTHLREWTGVR